MKKRTLVNAGLVGLLGLAEVGVIVAGARCYADKAVEGISKSAGEIVLVPENINSYRIQYPGDKNE